ncbi:MAG: hypothetical protein IPK19_13810 [Chloroflexi bacterium]|nr:hypothetical protein [Chloroflexota bacterium]
MKRRVLLLAIVILLGLGTTALAQDSRTADSTADWREDLENLMTAIGRHPDPYRYAPQTGFDALAAALDADIPVLPDAQIVVRMMEIVSLLQDGHSNFFPAIQRDFAFTLYPLVFYGFSDGVYLIDAAPEYADLVGARLVRIDATPVEDVLADLARLVPRDNDSGGRVLMPANLATAEVLLGLGVIDDPAQPRFLLDLPDGSQETINPAAIPSGEFLERFPRHFLLPVDESVLSRSRANQRLWSTPLNDGRVLYVQYNETQSLGDALDRTGTRARCPGDRAADSGYSLQSRG